MNYTISVTEDYPGLIPFFIANELEFGEEDAIETPTDILKCWRVDDEAGKLIGGFVLARRDGEYICDGIAVDPEYRTRKLGSQLLNLALDEIRTQGGKELYLVARAPGFFRKHGFEAISRENAPNFFECFACPQYGVNCHPEVMKKVINA